MTQENKDLNDSNELHDDAIQEIHENLIKDKDYLQGKLRHYLWQSFR